MLSRFVIATIAMFVLLACVTTPLHSIDLTVTGIWSKPIDGSDLLSGAGSNLLSTYESASDQVILDIANSLGGGHSWRVDVSRNDMFWNSDISLFVRRTSDGIGGSIAGGTSYLEITTSDQQLFTGSSDVVGIDVQYKIDNISISIPSGNYTTLIVYTIIDL